MLNTKRLVIATVFGCIFGFVCWGISASSGPTPWYMAVQTILARTLIGFTIGISLWKLAWWLHGIVIGGIVSLPLAFNGFFVAGQEMFIFWGFLVMGIVYGFLIELFTTVVFKAKA